MTVTGQTGLFGFGIQSAKGTLATKWYRHFVNDVNFGPIQDLRSLPLEVGSIVTPTGGYKAGVFVGGGASMQPRLEGDFGVLLLALMGESTSTPGTASATGVHAAVSYTLAGTINTGMTNPPSARRLLLTATGVTGGNIVVTAIVGTDDNGSALTDSTGYTVTGSGTAVTVKEFKTVTSFTFTAVGVGAGTISVGYYQTNSHVFKFATDPTSLPWVSARKKVPGSTSFGEIGKDCRLTGARFTFPANGLLNARVDMVGREPSWEEGSTVDNWSFVSTFEDFTSIPATCTVNGFVKLPTFSASALPITSLSVTMANNFTSPQQEMIIGSPYPDDFAILSRAMSLQAVVKWADATLYKELVTDGAGAWDPAPYFSDFQCKILTPGFVPGSSSIPYSVQIDAKNVMWQPQSAPVPAGGGIIMMPIVGQVMNPSSPSDDYAKITVVNEFYDYESVASA